MGGYWQLAFVCFLLVQSLSAEDSVKGNSASTVNDNSVSKVDDNSASTVDNNSASTVNDNSASTVDNSASTVDDNSTSVVDTDEELEKNIGQRIAALREMGRDEIHGFADLALIHFNSEEASVFTTLEDATVTVKKAIGSMLGLRMTLEKTNCTKKDIKHHRLFNYLSRLDSENKEPPKYCGPLTGEDKEQLDCKFDIFKNGRSYDETVVSHDCKPVKVIDKDFILGEHLN